MTAVRVVVIGVGNPFRGDDGAGPRVVELAAARLPAGTVTHLLDGEPARLIEAWNGADLAIVIDAAAGSEPPGTVRSFELGDVIGDGPVEAPDLPPGPAGTHGLGIGEAVALGRALGRLPNRLVVFAVTGERFDDGESLSEAVEQAAHEVAARVVAIAAGG